MYCVVSIGEIKIAFPQEDIDTIAPAASVEGEASVDPLVGDDVIGQYLFDGRRVPIFRLSETLLPVRINSKAVVQGHNDFCALFRPDRSGVEHELGFGIVCDKVETVDPQLASMTEAVLPVCMTGPSMGLNRVLQSAGEVFYGSDARLMSRHISQSLSLGVTDA